MPHVVIYNLINKDFGNIEKIEEAIIEASIATKELNLTEKDISFSFLSDISITSDRIPIIIIVELLLEKPERTLEVKNQFAQHLGRAVKLAILRWRDMTNTEVLIKSFNPAIDGFYSG